MEGEIGSELDRVSPLECLEALKNPLLFKGVQIKCPGVAFLEMEKTYRERVNQWPVCLLEGDASGYLPLHTLLNERLHSVSFHLRQYRPPEHQCIVRQVHLTLSQF